MKFQENELAVLKDHVLTKDIPQAVLDPPCNRRETFTLRDINISPYKSGKFVIVLDVLSETGAYMIQNMPWYNIIFSEDSYKTKYVVPECLLSKVTQIDMPALGELL